MKTILSTTIIVLLLVLFSGCASSLTLEDITRAQGISWWDVNVSAYTRENTSFGIAFIDEEGTIVPTSTMSLFGNIEAGYPKKVRVIAWNYMEPMIEFSILWDNGGGVRSSVTNRFDLFNSRIDLSTSGNTVDLGEPLISGCLESDDRPQKKLQLIMQANLDTIKSEPEH